MVNTFFLCTKDAINVIPIYVLIQQTVMNCYFALRLKKLREPVFNYFSTQMEKSKTNYVTSFHKQQNETDIRSDGAMCTKIL